MHRALPLDGGLGDFLFLNGFSIDFNRSSTFLSHFKRIEEDIRYVLSGGSWPQESAEKMRAFRAGRTVLPQPVEPPARLRSDPKQKLPPFKRLSHKEPLGRGRWAPRHRGWRRLGA